MRLFLSLAVCLSVCSLDYYSKSYDEIILMILMKFREDVDFTSYGAFKQSLTGVISIKFCKVYFM